MDVAERALHASAFQTELLTFVQNSKSMESVKNRRTIRKYKQQDIPAQVIEELLAEASRASTMGNMQLYSVIATRSEAVKKQLAPLHFNQPMVMSAPVVLTFCADFHRFSDWCLQRGATPGYDNLLSFINAATDALLVAQTFCTLAEEEGLGICYLGTTVYTSEQIIDVLHLPRLVMPLTTVTVGYPDECPPQPDRLPLCGFLHEEVYHDYTPERIDQIYAAKEALPENRHFVEINHKETLAQVFTDLRYTDKDNRAASDNLRRALIRQGFVKE